MSVQNFTAASTSSATSSHSGTPSADSSSSHSPSSSHTPVGAIVGGILGGLVCLGLLAGLALFFLHRHKKNNAALKGNHLAEMPGHGNEKYEMGVAGVTGEMDASTASKAVDAKYAPVSHHQSPQPQYELPGSEEARHELA